jgi:hypothetical protein
MPVMARGNFRIFMFLRKVCYEWAINHEGILIFEPFNNGFPKPSARYLDKVCLFFGIIRNKIKAAPAEG